MRFPRFIACFTPMMLAVLLLTACGKDQSQDTASTSDPEKKLDMISFDKPEKSAEADAPVSDDLIEQANKAIDKGAEFLIDTQNEDGSWGEHPHPAISGLCAIAIHGARGIDQEKAQTAIDKAMNYMLSFEQENGAIYPAERDMGSSANYPNYTTSIAMLAMVTIDPDRYHDKLVAARNYLKGIQFTDPDKVDFGGIGYGKTQRADLSNGAWAAEALYYTEYLEDDQPSEDLKSDAEMWKDMATFITKCQNLPSHNKQDYASTHPEDRGGFIYRPRESKAGEREEPDADGTPALISSGSMTYAGLKSMLYARLTRQDARVKAALDYLKTNYTLDENPGMGQQGLYYYLHSMVKALQAYGEPTLELPDGKKVNWREDVIEKYLEMQHQDGSWANDTGRYMESMPQLATSYALMSLKNATGQGLEKK